MHIALVSIIVKDYDEAIDFFVAILGFDLVADRLMDDDETAPTRWVEVRAPGSSTGVLLVRASDEDQVRTHGRQFAGHVGLFLHVEDFDETYRRLCAAGVAFAGASRVESYGKVAVFYDVAGNKWDLIEPARG